MTKKKKINRFSTKCFNSKYRQTLCEFLARAKVSSLNSSKKPTFFIKQNLQNFENIKILCFAQKWSKLFEILRKFKPYTFK